jgi:hypothetical protein
MGGKLTLSINFMFYLKFYDKIFMRELKNDKIIATIFNRME